MIHNNNINIALRTLTLFICIVLLRNNLNSQSLLQGIVIDSFGHPIDSVHIITQCLNQGANQQQTITNKSSAFILNLLPGTDLLQFKKQGYITLVFNKQQINHLYGSIKPIIQLKAQPYNLLEAVVVKATLPLFDYQLDRISMHIEGSSLEYIGSSMDLLKYGPGVAIVAGKILLNGHQAPGILVNGRKLNLQGPQLMAYLKNLKSSDIASIEIMAHPPANFDAEGGGGLINIILKKRKKQGIEGSVSFDYIQGLGKFPDYHPEVSLAYNKNKLGVKVGASHEYFKTFYALNTSREITGLKANYTSQAVNTRSVSLSSQTVGLSYRLNDASHLGLDYAHDIMDGKTLTNANNAIQYLDTTKNHTAKGNFDNIFRKNFSDISVNYIYKLDTLGTEFRILSDFANSKDSALSGNHSLVYNAHQDLTSDTAFDYYYPGHENIFSIQIDYKKIYEHAAELMIGAKMTNSIIGNHNYNQLYQQGGWIKDNATSFRYKYKEQILAGFINYKGSALNLDYQLGIRTEYSRISGWITQSLNQNSQHQNRYLSIFPTAYLEKALPSNATNYILFTYSRRIERPSYYQLNPFKYFEDNYTTSTGSPTLKPQFTNAVAFSYAYHNRFQIGLNYEKSNRMIASIIAYTKDSARMTKSYQNIGSSDFIYLLTTTSIPVTSWWMSNNTLNLGYGSTHSPNFHVEKFYFIAQLNQDLALTKSTSLNLFGTYKYHELWANFIYDPVWRIDLSIRKKMINNHLVVSLGIDDLFNTYGSSKAIQLFNQEKMASQRTFQSREVKFSINYRFNRG